MERPPRSSKACDACKRRKVKCNGVQNCSQCVHLNLKCVFSTPNDLTRSRKGIVRGHIIEAYKSDSVESDSQLLSPGTESTTSDPEQLIAGHLLALPAGFFDSLVDNYCTYVLPMLPIISGQEFRSAINEVSTNQLSNALVHSLAAMTIKMTRSNFDDAEGASKLSEALYTRAVQLRGPVMPDHQVTVGSIMIPLIAATCLYANYYNLDMAFYYFREAVTGLQVLYGTGIGPSRKGQLTSADRSQIQRLHWVLFVHERHQSLAAQSSALMSALQQLIPQDPAIPDVAIAGFNRIIDLFRIVDSDFLEHWRNKLSPTLSSAWIAKKQSELGDNSEPWEDESVPLSHFQKVDLIVTRHWLRTLVWQMALSKFLLTSDDDVEHECMKIVFPARISRHLRLVLTDMPRQMVEIHGTGILQKIFDITTTLADLLEHFFIPAGDEQVVSAHLGDFVFLHQFLLSMSEFQYVDKNVLGSRYETIQRLLSTSNVMLHWSEQERYPF